MKKMREAEWKRITGKRTEWKGQNAQCLTASFLLTVICGLFGAFQPLYLNVDNYQTALVLNQVYDADNYCMFLNPALCLISGILQKGMPMADGFTLLSRGMLLPGVWCLGYRIARASHRISGLVCGYLILFLLVVNASLFFDYFTIWASFFTCVGMVMLLWAMQEESRGTAAAGVLFLSCGVMWRLESAAVFLPFFLLDLFTDLVFRAGSKEERLRWMRRACRVLGPAVVCAALLVLADHAFKTSEKYKGGVEYSDAVSSVVDFPMADYDEIADQLPGISRNDYESLRAHLYADTDRIDAAYAFRISGAGARNVSEPGTAGLLKTNRLLFAHVISSNKTIFSVFLLFLLFLCLVLSDTVWYNKLELLLACGGAYLIMFYFTYIGRIPLRIINSVLYAVFGMALLLYGRGCLKGGRAGQRWVKRAVFFLVFLVVCVDTAFCEFVRPQSVFQVKSGADESRWQSTYGEEEIYLWETKEYVLYPMADFIRQGKFMTDRFLEHNLSYGDWVYGQVYYDHYLERLGIPNPVKALAEREGTYYVSSDETRMLLYLREHYDETIQIRKVREIEGIPVWKFLSSNNDKK